MNDNDLKGYRGILLDKLKSFKVKVWSKVEIKTVDDTIHGIILPRSETSDELHLVVKLDTGYNIGIHHSSILDIKEIDFIKADYHIPEKEFPFNPDNKLVRLFGTGGTIASRLDYRTGAVIPAFSPGELYASVPELADICNLETIKLYGVFSENITHKEWIELSIAIKNAIEEGIHGIVIGHGTDTMHYTSAILSFMIQQSPIPIVMVGSQRSSDRPSSDAAMNLIHATKTASTSDIAEVLVCMFGPTSDQYGLLHRGTRVRKMHSSSRSTFRTISDIPLATVDKDCVTPIRSDYFKRREDKNCVINASFDNRVSIVYYYPGMKPDIIESLIDNGYRGIVFAGTGLGHVNKPLYPVLKKARDANIAVYMTVQTLWGYVQMNVYETGRDMMELGVVPASNMLPEVCFVKLGWALSLNQDLEKVKNIMLTSIAGEITERETHEGYLIYQGGLPEIKKFIAEYPK